MDTKTNNASFVTLKEKVRGSIAVSLNAFDRQEVNTTDITLNTIRDLASEYDKKSIVRELTRYHAELDSMLNYEAGNMAAAEMMMADKARRQHCQAALKYLENKTFGTRG